MLFGVPMSVVVSVWVMNEVAGCQGLRFLRNVSTAVRGTQFVRNSQYKLNRQTKVKARSFQKKLKCSQLAAKFSELGGWDVARKWFPYSNSYRIWIDFANEFDLLHNEDCVIRSSTWINHWRVNLIGLDLFIVSGSGECKTLRTIKILSSQLAISQTSKLVELRWIKFEWPIHNSNSFFHKFSQFPRWISNSACLYLYILLESDCICRIENGSTSPKGLVE